MTKNIIIASFMLLLYSCNGSKTDIKENTQWESPNGYLFPTLFANEQMIWNVNGTANDTLQPGKYELIFKIENYNAYKHHKVNPQIRIKGIERINFKLLTNERLIKSYSPQIADSIGKLSIDFTSDSLNVYNYEVDMYLKFAKTDSIYKYNGNIVLKTKSND